MKAYVTEYVGQDIDNLDNNRVCGQSGYSYTKVLEPGTKYYVWVASIDEFGKPQAEVYVSDPIETLPKAVSNATVTATIDKYFNGDDLYALDNEKYADCQGQAYVMVTFAAENAKEWYGTMIAEDPNDPTPVRFPTTRLSKRCWSAVRGVLPASSTCANGIRSIRFWP